MKILKKESTEIQIVAPCYRKNKNGIAFITEEGYYSIGLDGESFTKWNTTIFVGEYFENDSEEATPEEWQAAIEKLKTNINNL